jgi:hypothetical protein
MFASSDHMFVTSDRVRDQAKLIFIGSDRTCPTRDRKSLTSADMLPLVGADGPELTTAVTSRKRRTRLRSSECGRNR